MSFHVNKMSQILAVFLKIYLQDVDKCLKELQVTFGPEWIVVAQKTENQLWLPKQYSVEGSPQIAQTTCQHVDSK